MEVEETARMLVPFFRDLLLGARDSLRGFLVVHKLDQPPKQRKSADDDKSPKKETDSTRPLSVLEARRLERARAEERESPTKRKQSEVLGRKPQAWKRFVSPRFPAFFSERSAFQGGAVRGSERAVHRRATTISATSVSRADPTILFVVLFGQVEPGRRRLSVGFDRRALHPARLPRIARH